MSVQSVCQLQAAATHDRSLFRNDRTALSMNSCGKSFHINSKAFFSSASLVGFGVYSVPVSHTRIIQWIERSGGLNTSEVIFKSESQFNYLFTLKDVHLSSNSHNFWMQPNITMNFAEYVVWILLCKHCKVGEKIYCHSRDIEFFLGVPFYGTPCILYDH